MPVINVGIVGLGNVGSGTLTILHENARQIEAKLGFPLAVKALCSRSIRERPPAVARLFPEALHTADWRDVVSHPEIHIVPNSWAARAWQRRLFALPSARANPW